MSNVLESEPRQLALGIAPRFEATFDHYLPGENGLILALLHEAVVAEARSPRLVYLWGEPGCGRSHLLQASCHLAAELGRDFFYLPLTADLGAPPRSFVELAAAELLCLDDIDQVAGDPQWEEALFHLLNRLRQNGHTLLATACNVPTGIGLKLPDLSSRLAAGVTVQLQPPNEADRRRLMKQQAERKGLALSDEAVEFILRRSPRGLSDLTALLERLDQQAWVEQRRLTIPFIKQTMNW